MKKIIVLLLVFSGIQGAIAQNDAVVMEIDGKPVTKNEFLQIYLKNNPIKLKQKYEKNLDSNRSPIYFHRFHGSSEAGRSCENER